MICKGRMRHYSQKLLSSRPLDLLGIRHLKLQDFIEYNHCNRFMLFLFGGKICKDPIHGVQRNEVYAQNIYSMFSCI